MGTPLLYKATKNDDDVDDAVALLLVRVVCTVSRTKLKANTYYQVFRIKPCARSFRSSLVRGHEECFVRLAPYTYIFTIHTSTHSHLF